MARPVVFLLVAVYFLERHFLVVICVAAVQKKTPCCLLMTRARDEIKVGTP